MLAFVKDAGYRIGEFEFKAGWLTDAEKSTLDVLASHYGDVARTPEKLSDEIDLSHLRADVRTFLASPAPRKRSRICLRRAIRR